MKLSCLCLRSFCWCKTSVCIFCRLHNFLSRPVNSLIGFFVLSPGVWKCAPRVIFFKTYLNLNCGHWELGRWSWSCWNYYCAGVRWSPACGPQLRVGSTPLTLSRIWHSTICRNCCNGGVQKDRKKDTGHPGVGIDFAEFLSASIIFEGCQDTFSLRHCAIWVWIWLVWYE